MAANEKQDGVPTSHMDDQPRGKEGINPNQEVILKKLQELTPLAFAMLTPPLPEIEVIFLFL